MGPKVGDYVTGQVDWRTDYRTEDYIGSVDDFGCPFGKGYALAGSHHASLKFKKEKDAEMLSQEE